MKNYKYDYDRTCFRISRNIYDEVNYYIKVGFEYIEVSKEVFKVCKSSYDKIRKDEKNKVDRSVYFFVVNKEIHLDIVEHIYLKDIAHKIKKEILLLSEKDKKIAICIFIKELSDRETAKILKLPQTTVTYRKKVIRKNIQEKIKNLCSPSQ